MEGAPYGGALFKDALYVTLSTHFARHVTKRDHRQTSVVNVILVWLARLGWYVDERGQLAWRYGNVRSIRRSLGRRGR